MIAKQSHICVYVLSPFKHTSKEVMLFTLKSTCLALSLYPGSQLRDVYTWLCNQAEPRLFVLVKLIRLESHAIQQLCSHQGLSSLHSQLQFPQ